MPAAFRSVAAISAKPSAVMPDRLDGVLRPVSARTITEPLAGLVVTCAPEIVASTSFSTTFSAIDTPTDSATPVEPKAAASDTPCAVALIRLSSRAITDTLATVALPPDRVATTFVAIWFVTDTPAPETPTPVAPPAMATDPAKTEASMA